MDWLFLRTDFYCEKGSNDFVGFELDVIRHRPFLLIVAGLLRDGERQHKPMTHKNLAYAAATSATRMTARAGQMVPRWRSTYSRRGLEGANRLADAVARP
jgi:hypothetical protein